MENENKIAERILSIDCAVGSGSVAVLNGPQIVASSSDLEGSPARAEEVLKVVKAVISRAGMTLEQIDKITVSVGPGSYSGIRIGLATAAGLAGALSAPCVGVSVLDALAFSATSIGNFVAAVGVGKRHIGSSCFSITEYGPQAPSPPSMQSDEDFGSSLAAKGEMTVLCDPSVASRVRAVIPADCVVSEMAETMAALIVRFAYERPEKSSRRPIYLRDQAVPSGQPVT
jgi:tRNA threonylcarbamoyladenosine biosynthesis protein TsaB